jgi:hypothetical protein
MSRNVITGWLGVTEPKETEYHREILFPAFSDEAAIMGVFDTACLPVTPRAERSQEKMIDVRNVFAGAGENSHQWINTPFSH